MKLLITQTEFDDLKSRDNAKLECLNCQQPFFLTKHRIQDISKRHPKFGGSFCSQKCLINYNINTNYLKCNCKYCNRELIRRPHEFNQSNNYFCNQSCSAKYFGNLRPKSKGNCLHCRLDFFITHKNQIFCCKKCLKQYKNFQTITIVKLICTYCGQNFERKSCNVNQRSFHFCSRSCQAKYANKTWNRSTRFGINKSKAETEMVKIIKKDFPDLLIIENDRKILNGLELDIYLPTKNLAIELNGPCHYIPIFGEQELTNTQNKDILKKKSMQELKIHFFQINIMGAGNKIIKILQNVYDNQIKPLLV